jgi:hypothetical protein
VNLTLRLFGLEILHIEASTEPEPDHEDDTQRDLSGGTTAATPMGFAPSYPDQRWESGAEYE